MVLPRDVQSAIWTPVNEAFDMSGSSLQSTCAQVVDIVRDALCSWLDDAASNSRREEPRTAQALARMSDRVRAILRDAASRLRGI